MWQAFLPTHWVLLSFLLTVAICQQTSLDCDFNKGTFCNWQAERWLTGDLVAVDAFHSIPRTNTATGLFAYAQGHFSLAPDNAEMRSPEIADLRETARIIFTYWKTAVTPTLDVCIDESGHVRCLDSVSGAGPQQWSERQVMVPPNPLPFRDMAIETQSFEIVIRARNLNSPIDLIGIDDIKFRMAEKTENTEDDSESELQDKNRHRNSISNSLQSHSNERDNTEVPPSPFRDDGRRFRQSEKTLGTFRDETTKTQKSDSSASQPILAADPLPGICPSIHCGFTQDACNWFLASRTMSSGWRVGGGSASVEESTVSMLSAPFHAPLAAFLDIDLSVSDSARLTVIEKSDGDETVIWTRRGLAGKGWHRLRIPVRSSISPLRIEIRANASGANAFIQLTNTKLADKDGFELFCDAVDETAIVQERLIAIQQITTEKTPFSTATTLPSTSEQPQLQEEPESNNGHRPIVPIAQTNSRPFLNSAVSNSWRTNAAAFENSPFNGPMPNALGGVAGGNSLNPALLERLRGGSSTALNEIVQAIGRQPAIASRLRSVAQQLGVGEAELDKLGQLIARGVAKQNAPGGSNLSPTSLVSDNLQPIQPVNAPQRESESPEPSGSRDERQHLSNEKSSSQEQQKQQPAIVPIVGSSRSLNGDLLQKLSGLLTLPQARIDADRPLAKQNLDFIVKNALSALAG